MASQSPTKPDDEREYVNGWAAMTKLMDSGASWSGRERHCAYLNLRDGTFADISAAAGIDFLDDGRAMALCDWDEDGDIDLWLKNRSGPQLRFMRNNDASGRHWIALKLVGEQSNRDAIGAIVEVYAGGQKRTRGLTAGEGYLAQSSKWLHFGLDRAERADRIIIYWPGSTTQEITDLAVDKRYVVTQGQSPVEAPRRSIKLADAPTESTPPAGGSRIVLRVPLPLPPSLTGNIFSSNHGGRAKLINLWAQWCAPCVAELTDFAKHYDDVHAAGLDIYAISLDEPADQAKAQKLFVERIMPELTHPGLAAGVATPEMRDALEVILRHILAKPGDISIPTSILVDKAGSAQVVYLGPVTVDQLLADGCDFGLEPDAPRARSAFPGRWYYGMPRDFRQLANDLADRDRREDARFYARLERARREGANP